MTAVTSSCWESVDRALECNDAKAAATAAQEGLRAIAYDERKAFFTQLCATLRRHGSTSDGASCVAEVGEQLWMMPEFRVNTSAAATVSGETLLLAAAIAIAYMALENYTKALAFDRELLQSPTFFTYDGFTVVERLACVARFMTASRLTSSTRSVDSAVQKGVSLYHGLAKARVPADAAAQQQRDAVVQAYLDELGRYRQERCDYLRAFHSFSALYESSGQAEALQRAALAALCIRSSNEVRQAALHDVLSVSSPSSLPSLYTFVHQAYHQQLFRAADTAKALSAMGGLLPQKVLRDALREHNVLLLANAFDCVHWRSLRTHMDDEEITEGELYDLLVAMVRAQRLAVTIHQDTGFIEFGGDGGGQQTITDADVFERIAHTAAAVATSHPALLA